MFLLRKTNMEIFDNFKNLANQEQDVEIVFLHASSGDYNDQIEMFEAAHAMYNLFINQ